MGDKRVFLHNTKNISSSDVIANFEICRLKGPLGIFVERWCVDTARNINAFA